MKVARKVYLGDSSKKCLVLRQVRQESSVESASYVAGVFRLGQCWSCLL